MTLNEFIKIKNEQLINFEKYWIEQNKINSEQFPMDIPVENEGIWDEMLMCFEEEN